MNNPNFDNSLDDIELPPDEQESLRKNKEEEQSFNKDKEDAERKNANDAATRALRSEFAGKSFWYLVGYSAFTGLILILQGTYIPCLSPYVSFKLDNMLLKILVGSTGVSIIGLAGIILRGLFKKE